MVLKKIKIAVTGPESVGKSILSEQLASYFNASLVKEYAREYLKEIQLDYTFDDIIKIAHKQIELENEAEQKSNFIICDSDSINFKIWLEHLNYPVPKFITDHIKSKPYTHSLLLYPNTEWFSDGLRENEDIRLELFNLFEKHLNSYHYNYSIISKLNEARFEQAKSIINKLL